MSSNFFSSICLAHIFFKNNRVIHSGFGLGLREDTIFSCSLDSYSINSRSSRRRISVLLRMFSATHKSHRICFPSFFVPDLSASKHSRHIKDGTPQVGQRRLPRYISHGLEHASHLPIISSIASSKYTFLSPTNNSSPNTCFVLFIASIAGGA